ncbi:hypothetical protein DSW25_06205 [Sulfitobacter donghicola DSW-25 = KCTC 12864 = JCM 14565]|uniref:Uncharacterized protein n=1 Tax=Sulfitobacter donghicola DSW-25 = KCTC 12864 = JCM 14565 TaxID=1300350 RepID=A0A073IL35_9RHOB|nr:hypothetical protein DSW25_06205 [Sulfitobacter donghicola DSW-25 = KCTC 12864 = JCM 14565]
MFEALNGWKPAESRTRPATIAAACVSVTGEETTGRAAAKAAGITERSFYRFRSSRHGQQIFAKLTKMQRKGAGHKAILRMIELSEQDENLSVAMRASVWLARFAGYSQPLQATAAPISPAAREVSSVIRSKEGAEKLVAQVASTSSL